MRTLELVPTALLSDASAEPIALAARIRPMWQGARFAGTALTVRTPPGQQLAVREALREASESDVIVVDACAALERALWGGNLSRLALIRGVRGVVVDGAVRDVEEIRHLGFPVFAVAAVPTPPLRDLRGDVGAPIDCAGVRVETGDIVYGDADGVAVVARAAHAETLARAHELARAQSGRLGEQ